MVRGSNLAVCRNSVFSQKGALGIGHHLSRFAFMNEGHDPSCASSALYAGYGGWSSLLMIDLLEKYNEYRE